MNGLKARIAQAMHGQAQPTVTVLSTLLAVQDELGYVPAEGVEEVAAFTKMTINDVWAVASFYPNFRFEPPCLHQVEVCWGASCHLLGAMALINAVLDISGLTGEGNTSDGRMSLRFNTCLGACSQAPVMSVDHHLIGRISPAAAREEVAALLTQAPEEPGQFSE